jgi:3D (Asp-Asp-Asp) domain-containing protein
MRASAPACKRAQSNRGSGGSPPARRVEIETATDTLVAMFMAMRRCNRTATGLLSVVLAACGSSSSGAVSSEDAGREGPPADATAGIDAESREDADRGIDAPEVADAAPTDDSSPAFADVAADATGDAGAIVSVYATFYGWADNSPPGAAIAYPKSGGYSTVHETAGGAGTYADPITFATDKAELPVGTILYVPFIEKYAIMEDDCVECDSDWTSAHKWHIDLWMNSNGTESSSALTSCEDRWTRTSTTVEIGPPADRVVTTTPIFVPSTNTCRTTP